jgi:hypothetical protein
VSADPHFLRRLQDVAHRFRDHASAAGAHAGLTGADPRTGERWDAGQVWAHTAEFPGYWLGQIDTVLAAWRGTPVPFGRVKSDPFRVAAIERDRGLDPALLHQRVQDAIADVVAALGALPETAWEAVGVHSTLGEMDLERIVEEFLVGHLEEHAAQLDELRAQEM